MTKNKDGTETIFYCECGQAVRFRKKDKTWIHYGWHKQFEPYSWFLDRTNHPVRNITNKIWTTSCLTIAE